MISPGKVMTNTSPSLNMSNRPPLAAPLPIDGISNVSLFLDFDGTLVDMAPSPDGIRVAPELPDLLRSLAEKLDNRLAIISGRSLIDLDKWLGPVNLAMAGSHGGEMRQSGSAHIEALLPPVPPQAEMELRRLARKHSGLIVEAKPFGVALHYRNLPTAEAEVLDVTASLAHVMGLTIKRGKMVVELLMPGADKGSAVEKFIQTPVFQGSRPLFVGDDLTDEDAFTKVLEYEGAGILVGPERETAARWRLPGVADVLAWLKEGLV